MGACVGYVNGSERDKGGEYVCMPCERKRDKKWVRV